MDKRPDFPYLLDDQDLIYFDSAATTQKPRVVLETMKDFYAHQYAPVHRSIYKKASRATENYEGVRKKVAEFINASTAEEIVFTRGTTSSLNLVARSFGKAFLKERDVILIPEIEHHSNIVPWQMMASEVGAIIETVPINSSGDICLSELEKKLKNNVKLVTLAHVSNVLGSIHPIDEVCHLAHKVGAKVVVDGAQAASHLAIDVQKSDIDFYAFSSHKMYGPTGVGVLYGKKDLLERMPPIEGGGEMIEKVSLKKSTFALSPHRFEAGTPMIGEVIGLGAALDFISSFGLQNIQKQEEDLLAYAETRLKEIPRLKILGSPKKRGPLLTFFIEGLHPLDIATFLDLKNIAVRSGHLCCQPAMALFNIEAALRISFALYNTKKEIDKFISALKEICSSLNQRTL